MAFTVTKYPQGTFSWADLSSSDVDASTTFLTSLFGWEANVMPTGTPGIDYTMFFIGDKTVAAVGPKFPGDSSPSYWSSYITVDDIEAMTAKAEELGASVLIKPMEVLNSGKMSGITDPTGANVMLWQPKKHIGAELVNVPGAMSWNELYTKDLEAAKQFYGDLFGWTFNTDDEKYTWIENNGRKNGGMFVLTPEMGDMPPNWTVYFTVENLEESVKKVTELGGQVWMSGRDISVGKIAMVAEPTGAGFMLLELSVPADDWLE